MCRLAELTHYIHSEPILSGFHPKLHAVSEVLEAGLPKQEASFVTPRSSGAPFTQYRLRYSVVGGEQDLSGILSNGEGEIFQWSEEASTTCALRRWHQLTMPCYTQRENLAATTTDRCVLRYLISRLPAPPMDLTFEGVFGSSGISASS